MDRVREGFTQSSRSDFTHWGRVTAGVTAERAVADRVAIAGYAVIAQIAHRKYAARYARPVRSAGANLAGGYQRGYHQ